MCCVYLQLSLFLRYCYLCKILVGRLAILVHWVHVALMLAVNRRQLGFAIGYVVLVLVLRIDPYNSMPIWILLLDIYSLRTPKNNMKKKKQKRTIRINTNNKTNINDAMKWKKKIYHRIDLDHEYNYKNVWLWFSEKT